LASEQRLSAQVVAHTHVRTKGRDERLFSGSFSPRTCANKGEERAALWRCLFAARFSPSIPRRSFKLSSHCSLRFALLARLTSLVSSPGISRSMTMRNCPIKPSVLVRDLSEPLELSAILTRSRIITDISHAAHCSVSASTVTLARPTPSCSHQRKSCPS